MHKIYWGLSKPFYNHLQKNCMSLLQGTRRFIVVSYNQWRKIYKNMQTKKYVILFQLSFIYILKSHGICLEQKYQNFFIKLAFIESLCMPSKIEKKKRKNFFTEDRTNTYLKVRHGHSVGHVLTSPLHF